MSRQRRLDRDFRRSSTPQTGCYLCGRLEAKLIGLYFPDKKTNVLLGAPPGKLRMAVYFLCEGCVKRPGAIAEVENGLIAEHAVPERN